MNKTHFSLLVGIFVISFFYQPDWVYENFWNKAVFYDSIPFTVPYLIFLLICAAVSTTLAELGIRFIKKYV
jgi:hypothetical protein